MSEASKQRRGTRRRRISPIAIAVTACLAAAIGIAIILLINPFAASDGSRSSAAFSSTGKKEIIGMWERGEFAKVHEATTAALQSEPADTFYLSMHGLASFFLSMERPEGEERQALLDACVFDLRKAFAIDSRLPVKAQAEYILGKAYYQKGSPWFDLAVEYLLKSQEDGARDADASEYLALAYAGMQEHQKAVGYFESALQRNPSDLLKLSAATSYNEAGDSEKALDLLNGLSDSASDAIVAQKARAILAKMALDGGDYAKALGIYQRIVDTDPDSADAWYGLGLAYASLSDPIKARAAWRKATTIDPNHAEARKKLAERL